MTEAVVPNSLQQNVRLRAGDLTDSNLTAALEITGTVDVDSIQDCLNEIIARRSSLRAEFRSDRDSHIIRDRAELLLRREVVTGPDPDERWRRAHLAAQHEGAVPFAIGESPLLRAVLYTTDRFRHLLLLVACQLGCDAWSINLVIDEVTAGVCGRPSALPPDEYAKVAWLRYAWLTGADGQAAVRRRTKATAGARWRWPIAPDPRTGAQSDRISLKFDIDPVAAAELNRRVAAARVTLFVAGVAALALAIRRGPDALVLTSTFACRETEVEAATVGWLSNEAAMVVPPVSGTVTEYMARLRQSVFASLADQRVPADLVGRTALGDAEGVSVGLLFLPRQLSGGATRPERPARRIARQAVSICRTGADVDLYMVEQPPMDWNDQRPPLRVGVTARTTRVGCAAIRDLMSAWATAFTVLARSDWSRDIAADLPVEAGDAGGPGRWVR